MKYSGIDLHSNNCVITFIDETDKVIVERRLLNDLEKIVAFLEPHRAELAGVVVKSTFTGIGWSMVFKRLPTKSAWPTLQQSRSMRG